ncbi:MAG: 5'-flap endonuclease [Bathelium mastoideum]|nr:MAG: 5'-flap endonuclease [Bathelium mastoideum]
MPASNTPLKTSKRSKSPKKKPRTITEIATAQYHSVDTVPPVPDLASKFFEPRAATLANPETSYEKFSQHTQEEVKARKGRKSSIKQGKDRPDEGNRPKTNRKPKSAPPRKRLYSPEAAMKRAECQDLLFASSSQLVSGESPTFIREIQLATRESEAAAVEQREAPGNLALNQERTAHSLSHRANRRLWSAAARDHDEGTLCAEQSSIDVARIEAPEDKDMSFVDIDHILAQSPDAAQAHISSCDRHASPIHEDGAERLSFHNVGRKHDVPDDTAPSEINAPHARTQCSALRPTSDNAVKSPKKARERPRKDPSQPPKARKPRKPPAVDQSKTTSSKRKSSTQKKSKSQARDKDEWINIDDISDVEASPTSSPPRRRASQSPSPVQPLELESTASKREPFTSTSKNAMNGPINDRERELWPALAARLFPLITAIIKSESPTMNLEKPSWHEKILMYDPIIVEDLTDWLQGRVNIEGLKKDGLKPWMTQKWCEENSICCVMKSNGWH